MKAKISVLLILLTLFQCAIPVTAEEIQNDKESILSGNALDKVFEDMKQSLKEGKEVSFEESLEKVGGLSVSMEPQYDLSDTSIDFNNLSASLTNLGFSQLSANLAGSFNNIDLSGSASGCTILFENSFGEVSQLAQLEKPVFPDSFNAETMLQESQNIIDKTYSQATNSETFKTTKEIISIGTIFDAASSAKDNAPSSFELRNISSMSNQLTFQLSASQSAYRGLYVDQMELLNQKTNNKNGSNQSSNDANSPYANDDERTWSDGLPLNPTEENYVSRIVASLKKTFTINEEYDLKLKTKYPNSYKRDPYEADREHLLNRAAYENLDTSYIQKRVEILMGLEEHEAIHMLTGDVITYAKEDTAEDIFLTSKQDQAVIDTITQGMATAPLIYGNSDNPYTIACAYAAQVLTDAWNYFLP